MNHANCFSGMFADASPSFKVTFESGPLGLLSRCAYCSTPFPELNVMNRRGSLMKLTPVLKSWPRPPMPDLGHEKSSRDWDFFCAVVCRVLTIGPRLTPLRTDRLASLLRSPV